MARKGILTTDLSSGSRRPAKDPARGQPRGAVGALQSSLNKLQENAVQEIDPGLIDDAGLDDRLGHDSAADRQLRDSLGTYGQQAPVLLRPHAEKPGRFEIVYGRRRLRALRELNLPVKAMIRHLDDQALVMAQGQENTARQDLSFIEKASFAAQLQAGDYDRQTIADALSIDMPMVSRMLKVGTAFDIEFLRAIGSAPGIGRDRWMDLVKAVADPAARARANVMTRRPEFPAQSSDDRFEAVLRHALSKPDVPEPPAPAKPRTLRTPDGTALADIRTTPRGVTLNIPARSAGAFGAWLDAYAEDLITDLHDRWQKEQSEDPDS